MKKNKNDEIYELVDELFSQVENLSKQLEISEKREKALLKENKKLRKEVNSVNFFDINQDAKEYLNLKREEKEREENIRKLFLKWKCFECGRGHLLIHTFFIKSKKHYFRKCDFCDHRTKSKLYNEKVNGLHYEENDID